jgi:hypothetical protein
MITWSILLYELNVHRISFLHTGYDTILRYRVRWCSILNGDLTEISYAGRHFVHVSSSRHIRKHCRRCNIHFRKFWYISDTQPFLLLDITVRCSSSMVHHTNLLIFRHLFFEIREILFMQGWTCFAVALCEVQDIFHTSISSPCLRSS